jgi:CBS domain-containing protein
MGEPSENAKDVIARLPVQVRVTECGGGEQMKGRTVRCPVSKGSVPFDRCTDCERNMAMTPNRDGPSFLYCRVPVHSLAAPFSPAGLTEGLQQTKVSQVMTSGVLCVDGELDLPELAQVLTARKRGAAPVVEDQGVLLGIVSKGDLVRGRERSESEAEEEGDGGDVSTYPPDCAGLLVEDVMTTQVVSLPEDASLAEAFQVMAKHGYHRVPVVSKEGVVVGILSMVDLVRWIARQPGAEPVEER